MVTTHQLSCIIVGTRSIDDNRQGPMSMAYSSLLSSNKQLILVQFHLGCFIIPKKSVRQTSCLEEA